MDWILQGIDIFLHLGHYLNEWAGALGGWFYVAAFLVIFCETGLVITPFLPGDSFLFAIGALAATPASPIQVHLVVALLIAASILGDGLNYWVGRKIGPLLVRKFPRYIKPTHIARTEEFFIRHGGKSVVLARFMPIIRTIAPFVAGIGHMDLKRFTTFNVFGGVVWVSSFIYTGYLVGHLPFIKERFHWVVIAIVVVSLLPILSEFLKPFFKNQNSSRAGL